MKTIVSVVFFLLFISIAVLFGGSCANIVPPQGGPRDTLPPVLLSAVPADSTLNFTGNKIIFTFDEYIDLQDVANNLMFTPLFQNNPRVEAKGKTITVTFRDTLEPNTTYILNFGNAIQDFNERNQLKGFDYTFSTGAALDSLEVSGKVIMAQTGRIDSTLVVVLHKNLEDSAVMNQRPMYATRLDSRGTFRFRNLPSGTFAIYAIGDAGLSRRYMNKTQAFAFADSPIHTQSVDTALTLYAYKEIQTTGPAIGPVARTPARGEPRLSFTTNLTNNQQDLNNDLLITFSSPLQKLDSAGLQLYSDSVYNPEPFTTALDSTRRELRLRSAWKEGTTYQLIMDRDFATDTLGRKLLKTDTLVFTTRSAADYGMVTIRLRNVDLDKNPVLQFVQNDLVVFSAPVKSGSFAHPRFIPGDYDLRILYDENDNGKWDPGQFFGEKRQPELVRPMDQKITIKPNWENDFERSL